MNSSEPTRDDRPIPVPPTPISTLAHRYRPTCVADGKPSVIISNGRCVHCREEPMRFCPWCSRDIHREVEYEVASRWRAASNAINDIWLTQDMYQDYRTWQRILAARKSPMFPLLPISGEAGLLNPEEAP